MSLLGMYVHTHWSYNAPYAARTWTWPQWQGFMRGLKGLGYNLIQVWPMLDTMPWPPTPSDRAQLEKLRQVIEYAHTLQMSVYVGICANTSPNDRAAQTPFEERRYFEVERLIDPRDEAAVTADLSRRRNLLEHLREADGLWIIDSDPGGYPGSPVSDFVALLGRHRELLDALNPRMKLIYWMWAGWVDQHQWGKAWTDNAQNCWTAAIDDLKRLNPEPWAVHACWPGHFKVTEAAGIRQRVHYYPYGVLEPEPSYPLTRWQPQALQDAFARVAADQRPLGVLVNSQTQCLQLPHTYLFAHLAHGGSMDDLDLAGMGERLLPGAGPRLKQAWEALGNQDVAAAAAACAVIRELRQRPRDTGDLCGLLFGSPHRFLQDLEMQLDLWNRALALRSGSASPQEAVRSVTAALLAWTQRHGFRDRFGSAPASDILRWIADALSPLSPRAADAAAVLRRVASGDGPCHGLLNQAFDAIEQALS